MRLLTGLWAVGVIVQLLRIGWQNAWFAVRLRRRPITIDPAVLQLMEECKTRMRVRQRLALVETPEVRSPGLYGLFRPQLLLPQGITAAFTLAELRYVFLHELGHVKRLDMAVNWLMTVLQVVHWFNPLVWFGFRRMRADRELACDALVLSYTREEESRSYGEAIIKLLEGFARPPVVPGLVGILEEKEDWFRGKIYWSADSERILFVKWNRQMRREAGSINLRDGRVSRQPNYADFGLLSPDGKTLAYSVANQGIWASPPRGGSSRIVRGRSGGWLFDDVALWTPDSQWVVSAIDGWWREEIHFTRFVGGREFEVFPPETVGTFIGKSTDEKKLLFYRSSYDLRTTIKVLPVSGSAAFNVGPTIALDTADNYSWTADAASVAVTGTGKEGAQSLLFIPIAGGNPVRFKLESLGKAKLWLWSLSPDSKKMLYGVPSGPNQGNRGADFYCVPISVRDGQPTGPSILVFEGWQHPMPGTEVRLAWSPDGTKIAIPHKGDKNGDLWIASVDGGRPVQVSHTPNEVEQFPQWSPKGKMIAFNLHSSDHETLQVVSVEGGTARTILATPSGQIPPVGWSPDSGEVVVAHDGMISGFPVTGGEARQLIKLEDTGFDYVSWLAWSPDGRRLAFYAHKSGEATRLCLFWPNDGKIEKLVASPASAWSFSWAPDSRMISCTAEEAVKTRSAGVVRELDVADAVQRAKAYLATTPPANPPPLEYAGPKNPPPLVNGEFRDSFDDVETRHWDFWDPSTEGPTHEHGTKGGELVLENTRANLGSPNWTNYVVKVRICIKTDKGRETLAGLGFRRGQGGTYYLCPEPFARNLWLGLQYRDPTGTLRHGSIVSQPFPFELDKWYSLQCEVIGSRIKAFVDGKLVIETDDDRQPVGHVALLAGNSRVHFDDFSIQLLQE